MVQEAQGCGGCVHARGQQCSQRRMGSVVQSKHFWRPGFKSCLGLRKASELNEPWWPHVHIIPPPASLARWAVSARERLKAAIVGEGPCQVGSALAEPNWAAKDWLAKGCRAAHTDSEQTELCVGEVWTRTRSLFLSTK